MSHLSVSQFTQFKHCRYSWYLSYMAAGTGIKMKDHFLPNPIKLGAIWDEFQNQWYSSQPFTTKDFTQLADRYNISDDDHSRMFGLIRAWHKMGWQMDREGISQSGIDGELCGVPYKGFVDVFYSDRLIENKLSGRPNQYRSIYTIHDQGAMYMLARDTIKDFIVRATATPMLRKKKGEDDEAFMDRVTKDVLARPSKYFLGLDREKMTYGIRFHRNEFDLDSFKQDFKHVWDDIQECREDNTKCYPDKLSCFVPAQCMYLPVCEAGDVNWSMYEKKKEAIKNDRGEPEV